MKNIYLLLVLMLSVLTVDAQTLDELKAQKAGVVENLKTTEAKAGELKTEIDRLQGEIDKLSGWVFGLGGNVGFSLGKNNKWVNNPHPTSSSSSLRIGVNAFANNIKEKTIWTNSLIVKKAWQDVDKNDDKVSDDLFDNGIQDELKFASLYGYRIHPKFAITGLGELNSSLGSFMKPGTVDIGVGGTWTPTDYFRVIVHPLNYHLVFSGFKGVESTGVLGCKLKAIYERSLNLFEKKIGITSIFTSFIPYNNDKQTVPASDLNPVAYQAGTFEYEWSNTFDFILWRGIGANFQFGLRSAELETKSLQTTYNFGLAYQIQ